MDSKEKCEISLVETLKKPYTKITIVISIIIIISMYLTQSYWMNIGLSVIYKEYQAEEILPNNSIPEGVFILSGNYSYISEWINVSKLNCSGNVRLLVYPYQEFPGFKSLVILDTIEGCNNKIK